MKPKEKEITIRDAITAGSCKAFNLEVNPPYNQNEVLYVIRGDVDNVLKKISENRPIGSRDALEAINNCRSAIFLFRHGGQR